MAEARTPWQLASHKVEQRCGYLLTSGLWSDCIFMVGSATNQEVIQAHKFILAMASPVFEAMFYGGLAERYNPMVSIPDLQPETFRALLRYIYTGNINICSFDMACDLCYGAHKYMLPYLARECCTYIWTQVCPRNACQVYELAWLFDEITLMDVCIQMISTNTKEVLNDSSFEDVKLNTLITVCSLEHLTVDSELDLFNAVARYAEAEQRRQEQISAPEDGPPAKKLSELILEIPVSEETVLLPSPVELDSKSPNAAVTSEPTTDEDNLEVPEWALYIRAAIEKIRFLSLTAQEFAEGPACSDLLTMDEWFAVLMNIISRGNPVAMPTGFSECRQRRRPRRIWMDEGPIAMPCPKPSTEYFGVAATKSLTSAEIVRGLSSRNQETLEQAARAARHMTCADGDGTSENITQLVAAGYIPPLVTALHHPSAGVKYDAAWAITNIASNREHIEALVDDCAVPVLLALLEGGAGAVSEQAAWALGNIAGDGVNAKDAVVNVGAPSALLPLMQTSTPPGPLATYVRTYRIICQKPTSTFWLRSRFEQLSPAVPYIENILLLTDEQVLVEACWTLYYLAGGAYFNPQLFTPSLTARLTTLLGAGAAPRVQTAALAAVGSMLLRTELRDRCLEAGCLDPIINFLKCGNPSHVETASLAAGYVLRSTPHHIQEALDKGMLDALVPALTKGYDTCKYNAALAICRLCYCGFPSQLAVLAVSGALEPYCRLIAARGDTCQHVLQGLTQLLREQKVEQNTKVALLLKLREIGVPQLLMTMHEGGNKSERELANCLLQNYFRDNQ